MTGYTFCKSEHVNQHVVVFLFSMLFFKSVIVFARFNGKYIYIMTISTQSYIHLQCLFLLRSAINFRVIG